MVDVVVGGVAVVAVVGLVLVPIRKLHFNLIDNVRILTCCRCCHGAIRRCSTCDNDTGRC